MDWKWIIFGILALVVLVIVLVIAWVVRTYNRMVSYSARVDNSWSQIDVQLKKRFDLIPNLVETVKGYASHEKSTLEEVTKWRSAAMNAKTPEEAMEANGKLGSAMVNLFSTAEQYPDLKANQNFLALHRDLNEIEGKVAVSRQFYNDTVMRYNECITKLPGSLLAGAFHFNARPYFQADETERSAPQVKF